jgi:hypothetical protein
MPSRLDIHSLREETMTITIDYTYPIGSFGLAATKTVSKETGVIFLPFNHRDKFNGNQTTHFSGTHDQTERAKELLDKYVMRKQRWLIGEKKKETQTTNWSAPAPAPAPAPSRAWGLVSHDVSFAKKVDNWTPPEEEIQSDMDEILDAIIQLPGITNEMKGEMLAEEIFLDMYFEETEPSLFENYDNPCYNDMTTFYPIAERFL